MMDAGCRMLYAECDRVYTWFQILFIISCPVLIPNPSLLVAWLSLCTGTPKRQAPQESSSVSDIPKVDLNGN